MSTKPSRTLSNHLYEKLTKDLKFLPQGSWVDKNKKKVREADIASVDSWCRAKYALKGVSNVPLDLPPSYREQVDRHIDQLMDNGLGDVVAKAINGDKSDFEKFLEKELPKEKRGIRTARGKIQARGKMKNAAKHSKEILRNFKKNRRPIVPLKKKIQQKVEEKEGGFLKGEEKDGGFLVHPVGDTAGDPMWLPGDTKVWCVDERSHTQALMKEKIQQLEKLKKKKEPCRCNKCMAKSLGKTIKEYQTPKTVNNVDPVKEARRQARKARIQVAKLKEAAREARRQTVEDKRRVDPYAAVKARKIQEEQEARKFKVQNPHNGLAISVRVMSGYSKPNPKRRRR